MNVPVARLFQAVPILLLAVALVALAILALAAASGWGAREVALTDVAPFRWA